ncbi:universal stress protein [Halegenticoccus soli]|uniref:universal stress protein n=1 Tax=Halegenticoccus soli TaxID=1985678 RepID=UPI000C6E0047|nr:universal stress protein [Halegenticoccus soli]
MYSNVLIPTDGSGGTHQAVQHGLTIAQHFESTVHVLAVIELAQVYADGPPDLHAKLEERATDALEAVAKPAHDMGLRVRRQTRTGAPETEIIRYATENGIDLIVMGKHGRSRFHEFFVGSTTSRVLRKASVPVLTARIGEPERRTSFENILIATGGGPEAEGAIEHGLGLADAFGGSIHALYVLDPRVVQTDALRGYFEEEGNRAIEAVSTRATRNGIQVHGEMREGNPPERIIEYATQNGCDLIVLGARRRGDDSRGFVGSVAERVVRAAQVPVLTVRDRSVEETA